MSKRCIIFFFIAAAATTRPTADYSTIAQWPASNHYIGQSTEFIALAASATINAESTSSGHQNYNIKWNNNTTNIFSSRVARSIYSGRL